MMQQALNSFFGVITSEAGRNPGFATELQSAILKMSDQIDKSNLVQNQAREMNPFALFKTDGRDGMEKALNGQKVDVLRTMVKLHNADPAGLLGNKGKKGELVEAMVKLAERRAERDARLFNY